VDVHQRFSLEAGRACLCAEWPMTQFMTSSVTITKQTVAGKMTLRGKRIR
jgi:hypothetical protein